MQNKESAKWRDCVVACFPSFTSLVCSSAWRASKNWHAYVLGVLQKIGMFGVLGMMKCLTCLKLMKCFLDVFDQVALVNCGQYELVYLMESSKLLDTQVFKSIIQVYILEIAETIVINIFCGFWRVLFLFTIS